MEKGIVYMPYIVQEHTKESLVEYKKFMKEYKKNHRFCPNCGGTGYITTLMGYILDSSKREEYKDLNQCVCDKCENVHTVHDRVKEFKKK